MGLLTFLLNLLAMPPISPLMYPMPVSQYRIVEQWHASQHHHTSQPAPLPVSNSTRSFWLHPSDTRSSNETYEDVNPLAKEGSEGDLTKDADVCIIGSGISGVGVAYHLSKLPMNRKVVILEARDFCSGATGRNGGHLTPAYFQNFRAHLSAMGLTEAKKQYALEQHTAEHITSIVDSGRWSDDVDLVNGGHVQMLVTDEEVDETRADYEAAADAGLKLASVSWISKEEMLKFSGASNPGFSTPAHNIWPLKLVTRLYDVAATLFKSQGGSLKLHTKTPVTSVKPTSSEASGRSWVLGTPRGNIRCKSVVHTTNGYASHLLPHMAGPKGIVPVRGQIIATRGSQPLHPRARASWGGNAHFEYWFPRPVKTPEDVNAPLIILGGGRECCPAESPGNDAENWEGKEEKWGYEVGIADDSRVNEKVGKALRSFLPSVFPGMYEEGREPEMEWTGILGFTSNNDPFVGPVHDANGKEIAGQYISAGFSGHGMPRAFGCAEVLAGIIQSDLKGDDTKSRPIPDWIPQRYLTWNRV